MHRAMNRRLSALLVSAVGLCAAPAFGQGVVTFDNGTEGWSVSGRDNISPVGGNPGANMDVELIDVFGAEIRNNTNPAFLGDYTRFAGGVELSVQINMHSLTFFGQEVPRNIIIELRNYSNNNGYPWTSVWFNAGQTASPQSGYENGADENGWATFSVVIEDPTALALPDGWGGTGDEDPMTYMPRLPAGWTFADVLANVDELVFTTFEPGYFYGFTNFIMQVDNISVTPISLACNPADLNAASASNPSAPGWGEPDGLLTPTDFTAFAFFYSTGDLRADLNTASATNPGAPDFGVPDGQITPSDFTAFVSFFNTGCP